MFTDAFTNPQIRRLGDYQESCVFYSSAFSASPAIKLAPIHERIPVGGAFTTWGGYAWRDQ